MNAAATIEGEQLHYIRTNQERLRAIAYQGVIDHVRARAEVEQAPIGRIIILPSTFSGSQRNVHQNY